jgi:hypothetical protein
MPALGRASAARWACTSCPRSAWAAAPCPRWLAHNLLLTRTEAVGAGGWIARRALRAGAGHHQRFGVKAGGPQRGGQEPVGRQPAEVHRRPRDRRQPEAADRLAAHLGRGRGRGAQIRGEMLALRDAGCAVLVVSEELDELFEISDRLHGDGQGAAVAQRWPWPTPPVEQIGEWMSGLWHAEVQRTRWTPHRRRPAMLKLEPRPAAVARSGRWLAAAGAGHHRADRRGAVRAAGQGPGARPAGVLLGAHQELYALGELMVKATPLLLIALGLAVCFRSNVWNIGAEGQFVMGAIAAGGVALLAGQGHRPPGSCWPSCWPGCWAAWPGRASRRCCATASTPTKSWSA